MGGEEEPGEERALLTAAPARRDDGHVSHYEKGSYIKKTDRNDMRRSDHARPFPPRNQKYRCARI